MRLLREAFIPSLVSLENDQPVRRVADWNEIPEAARPLIDKFVGRRLLVRRGQEGPDGTGTGGVVEVALESLFRNWDELRNGRMRNARTSRRRLRLSATPGMGRSRRKRALASGGEQRHRRRAPAATSGFEKRLANAE